MFWVRIGLITCALHEVQLCEFLHARVLWLDEPIVHLLLEVLRSEQAVKHLANRCSHLVRGRTLSEIFIQQMLHRPHDNFSLEEELQMSQILILNLVCNSPQVSDVQSVLMESIPQALGIGWDVLVFA